MIKSCLSRITKPFRRFGKDQKGIAAIEFAFVLPVMVILALGSWELSLMYLVKKRTDHAATVLADLATQEYTISNASYEGYEEAVRAVMFPFQNRTLRMHIMGVRVDANRNMQIAWQRTTNNGTGLQVGDIPQGLRIRNSFYVIAEVESVYTSDLFHRMIPQITMRDQSIMVPRLTTAIEETN